MDNTDEKPWDLPNDLFRALSWCNNRLITAVGAFLLGSVAIVVTFLLLPYSKYAFHLGSLGLIVLLRFLPSSIWRNLFTLAAIFSLLPLVGFGYGVLYRPDGELMTLSGDLENDLYGTDFGRVSGFLYDLGSAPVQIAAEVAEPERHGWSLKFNNGKTPRVAVFYSWSVVMVCCLVSLFVNALTVRHTATKLGILRTSR